MFIKSSFLNSKIGLFFILLLILSCKKNEGEISDVPVNISIDLNDPVYRDLRFTGNRAMLTGGHAGIIVYRLNEQEFRAFDRICPVEIKTSCRINTSNQSVIYRCACCNSPYSILDGIGLSVQDSTFAGSGKLLKQYKCRLIGNMRLDISNF